MAKRIFLRMLTRVVAPIFILTLIGCTGTGIPYDPSLAGEPLNSPAARISGRALIWTTVDEDELVLANFRVGELAREISLDVFSQIFEEGVVHSNSLPDEIIYSALITPRVTSINYGYDYSGFLWRRVRPEVRMELQIQVSRQTGELILEREYSRGPVFGDYSPDNPWIPTVPFDEVEEIVHEVITEILNQAASDTYDIFQFRQLDTSLTYVR